MLMILDDRNTIKTFTDDINTMNVEYMINKTLHIINIIIKIAYIIIKIVIKQNVLFQMPNKQVDELTLITDGVDIERVNQFNSLLITYLNWSKHRIIDKIANRCYRTIGIIIKLLHIIQIRINITLYNSIILPHTNYYLLI